MYFKLNSHGNTDLSWIIVKNPSSGVFTKEISNNEELRVIRGSYVSDTEYQLNLENNSIEFLKLMRKLNKPNYLHSHLSTVCPYNLKAIDVCFRSALRGNNAGGSLFPDEKFNIIQKWSCVFGPFTSTKEWVIEVFNSVDLKCTVIEDDVAKHAYMLNIETEDDHPSTLTEFLQKIYVMSYYISYDKKHSFIKMDSEKINKFIEFCKNWLYKSPKSSNVISRFSNHNLDKTKNMEEELIRRSDRDEILKSELLEDLSSKYETVYEKIKDSLHAKRHNIIINKLIHILKTDGIDSNKHMIDIASSEGMFLNKLCETKFDEKSLASYFNILGVDADGKKIIKLKRKVKKSNIKALQCDVLTPDLNDKYFREDYDIVTCIEFIEHLNKKDRLKLLQLILELYIPKYFYLTTPNISYNVKFGMPEGKLRRKDHVIEYDEDLFNEEVVKTLESKYIIEHIKINEEEDEQPSFVIFCTLKEDVNKLNKNSKLIRSIKNFYDSIYLNNVGYTIKREMMYGTTQKSYIENKDVNFYMAPTIAPVEYNEQYGNILEHPSSAIEYFKSRGVKQLIIQEKYMGSRGHILLYKNVDLANKMGYESPITVISRGGYNFFYNDQEKLNLIYNEISPHMEHDFLVLDSEICPWKYKAEGLALNEFVLPGESAYLSRKYNGKDVESTLLYLKSLKNYFNDDINSDDIKIYPFHVLGFGNIIQRNGAYRYLVEFNGFSNRHDEHMDIISKYVSKIKNNSTTESQIFQNINYMIYNIDDSNDDVKLINFWNDILKRGSEGIVVKPINFIQYGRSGTILQPALKVRSIDYLRLIYGIDYLDPEYFNIVKNRFVKNKRGLALKETEIGMNMFYAFLQNNEFMRKKYYASFLGVEGSVIGSIDATL